MKYIYYIAGIVIVFSALAAYGLFDSRIEVSEPVLSVNDRIFSKAEIEKLLKHDLADMSRDQFIDALVEKHILIQEAVEQKINSEENFRRSVENFYEQSLIKILLDRKLKSIVVDVTTEEVARYEELTKKKVKVTKMTYPSMTDLENRTNETIKVLESDFLNLSDNLKFTILSLEKGYASSARKLEKGGAVIYRLDDIFPLENMAGRPEKPFDVKRVSLFMQNKKKEERLNEWIAKLRESADIWRK